MKRFALSMACLLLAGCDAFSPAQGKITIDSVPRGAEVTLNGRVCPASPCNFELPPGEYPVIARLLNYQHVQDTVTVSPNGNTYKTLHLLRMAMTEEEARQLHLRKKPEKADGPYQF